MHSAAVILIESRYHRGEDDGGLAQMFTIDDPRWDGLCGGYRVPYDPRPALASLARGASVERAWNELWNELHHQGDVGEASYAAVSELVRIHAARGMADWNTYALVATIEDARANPRNPAMPSWLEPTYGAALHELVGLGLREIGSAEAPELVASIIAVVAFGKGQRSLAQFAIAFTEDERREILSREGFG
jgi:hypothetical protein